MKINEKNLYVFAKTPPYDMEGFLNKRGEVNKAFQRRYFILKGNLLFYFETRLDKEPLGLIIVEGCTIELSNEVDNYCFEIAFNGNRTYILAAENQDDMEKWMKALTCAGYEYKRIIVAELQRQLQEIEEARNKLLEPPDESNTEFRPKPPPRRTNPFNRPAPPPPSEGVAIHQGSQLHGGVVMSPMPFINGYFGSSNAKMQQQQQLQQQQSPTSIRSDGNGNTGSPLVIRRHAPHLQPQQQLVQSNFTTTKPTVLPRNNNNNNNHQHQQYNQLELQKMRAKAMEDFKRHHEHYRKELMPDITAHRQRQGQPLIQF
ncbi:sesquipedalian-1 isoform X2 [Drosophila willistoni]|uniref:sesquipedalian-1 isoform X2 n=1 Tax=Drosophila willistoni TaxID=7260 RepID=UPI001F07D538|nr:sesquipedalian-1 isoform X2 [Drosophila willistoni]